MQDQDARIAAEYADGREAPEIAARYDVPEAYVERVIEEAVVARPERRRGLDSTGNRAALALLIGWLVWLPTRSLVLLLLFGIGFYALITAIVRRR